MYPPRIERNLFSLLDSLDCLALMVMATFVTGVPGPKMATTPACLNGEADFLSSREERI
ncbi:MAG: hypothetical protein LBB85_04135 [Dysgonamonadaceae bacterium]|nr:hypothetical protein [Dysgonamonadaceae bacterium]